jgi:hypothetical protein
MYIDGIGEIDENASDEEIFKKKELLEEKKRLEEENERLKSRNIELKSQMHASAKKEKIGRNE